MPKWAFRPLELRFNVHETSTLGALLGGFYKPWALFARGETFGGNSFINIVSSSEYVPRFSFFHSVSLPFFFLLKSADFRLT